MNAKEQLEWFSAGQILEADLGAHSGSVAVKFCVGLDVVGIDGQRLRIELIGRLEIAVFKSLITFFLLSLQCFGILQEIKIKWL